VYYGASAPASKFSGYQLVVFAREAHPPIAELQQGGTTVLGYVSVGEINRKASYFNAALIDGLLVTENPHWDSFAVDLRDPRWQRLVIEDLALSVLSNGFDGLFLDTIDHSLALEERDPARFAGMRQAAIDLVRLLRQRYPSATIMVNRAFEILPEIEDFIDIVLAESIYTVHQPETDTHVRTTPSTYEHLVAELRAAQRRQPRLRVFTLDYWDLSDRDGVREIYEVQRRNGFLPYVSTMTLDQAVELPGCAALPGGRPDGLARPLLDLRRRSAVAVR
jgi:polysaccharide biosynthesis protein PelA